MGLISNSALAHDPRRDIKGDPRAHDLKPIKRYHDNREYKRHGDRQLRNPRHRSEPGHEGGRQVNKPHRYKRGPGHQDGREVNKPRHHTPAWTRRR